MLHLLTPSRAFFSQPLQFGLVSALAASAASPAEAAPREAAPRRVLLFAPSALDARYGRQLALWRGAGAGLRERDVVRAAVFLTPANRAIRARYGVRAGDFRVVLIGRDGNAALSSKSPLSAARVFARIDAMPMRREEMRRQNAR